MAPIQHALRPMGTKGPTGRNEIAQGNTKRSPGDVSRKTPPAQMGPYAELIAKYQNAGPLPLAPIYCLSRGPRKTDLFGGKDALMGTSEGIRMHGMRYQTTCILVDLCINHGRNIP